MLLHGLAVVAGLVATAAAPTGAARAQIDEPAVPEPAVPGLPLVDETDEPAAPAADDTAPAVAVNWGVPPVQLMIPALGVEAPVEAVGQEPDGAMATPTDPDDVAWYQGSPGMGVPGNPVFAAHINWANRLRPFGLLHELEPGDVVQVIDAQGRGYEYAVESSHWVRAEGAPIEDIFAQPQEQQMITLITCGGEYVPATREYLDRLIVRARGA
ncbi:MAG: class F sortase [Chloroflexota bacterium]